MTYTRRVLVIGDYDLGNVGMSNRSEVFRTINREFNTLLYGAIPVGREADREEFRFIDPDTDAPSGWQIYEPETDTTPDAAHDVLLVFPRMRGAAAIARGVARMRQIPFEDVDIRWEKWIHACNTFDLARALAEHQVDTILNFETRAPEGPPPYRKSLLLPLLKCANNIPCHTFTA